MRLSVKLLVLAAILPGLAFSQTLMNSISTQLPFLNITAPNEIDGLTAGAIFTPTGTIATQGIAFSTKPSGNPLVLDSFTDVKAASANTAGGGFAFLSSVTGRTIYPGTPTVMVSGTAATATSEIISCSPSQRKLATIPIALLVTSVPVTPYSSSAITAGIGLGQGCAIGDSVNISTGGSGITTTTDIFINMPYTVQ